MMINKINLNHKYSQDQISGNIFDIFGKELEGIDDIVEELNFLMGILIEAKENLARPSGE